MSRNPLDSAISSRRSEKKSKRGILYTALLGVAGLGAASSVFAASITINNSGGADAAISFSQGTQTIAACDTDGITASLGAFWDTTPNPDAFSLDTISLTGVSDSCDGKTLTLTLYNGSTKLATVTGGIQDDASTTVLIGRADNALTSSTITASSAAVTDLDSTPALNYEGSPAYDAGDLAADATQVVIEIN